MLRRHHKEPPVPRSQRGAFERYVIGVPGAPHGDHNNYLLVCAGTHDAVLIDACGEAQRTLHEIDQRRARVRMIVLTHGHAGHWAALGQLRDALHAPIGVHLDDVDMLPLTPTFALAHNQRLAFGAAELLVIHTPGHSPGSVCFIGDGNLFSGDTLLAGRLGATTAPLSDQAALVASLRQRIFSLADSTAIFPGHGPASTLGAERSLLENPQE